MFSDSREHSWADFFAVVKGEHVIGKSFSFKNFMGSSARSFHRPANSQEGIKYAASFRRRPGLHAVRNVTSESCAAASPCSSRSAIVCKASAFACAIASSGLLP